MSASTLSPTILRLSACVLFGVGAFTFVSRSTSLIYAQSAGDEVIVQATEQSSLTPVPQPSLVPTSSSSTPAQNAAQMQALRDRYRTELSIYRSDEEAYQLAKAEYAKLETFVSLEKAVQSTQKVMSSRIDVLETYIQMIRLTTTETVGIDVTQKTALYQEIDSTLERLKRHQDTTLRNAIDRNALATAVTEYAELNKDVTSTIFKSLSYIAYGRIQAVYDKTLAIKSEVKSTLERQELNGLALGEKRRAFDELERRFLETESKMKRIQDQFVPKPENTNRRYDQGTYNSYQNDLSTVYAELLRTVDYLREVINS